MFDIVCGAVALLVINDYRILLSRSEVGTQVPILAVEPDGIDFQWRTVLIIYAEIVFTGEPHWLQIKTIVATGGKTEREPIATGIRCLTKIIGRMVQKKDDIGPNLWDAKAGRNKQVHEVTLLSDQVGTSLTRYYRKIIDRDGYISARKPKPHTLMPAAKHSFKLMSL